MLHAPEEAGNPPTADALPQDPAPPAPQPRRKPPTWQKMVRAAGGGPLTDALREFEEHCRQSFPGADPAVIAAAWLREFATFDTHNQIEWAAYATLGRKGFTVSDD